MEGDLMPLTALWANAGGEGEFRLRVSLPNGTLVEDWSGLLFLPFASDPWVPNPWTSANATCPEPEPVFNYRSGESSRGRVAKIKGGAWSVRPRSAVGRRLYRTAARRT